MNTNKLLKKVLACRGRLSCLVLVSILTNAAIGLAGSSNTLSKQSYEIAIFNEDQSEQLVAHVFHRDTPNVLKMKCSSGFDSEISLSLECQSQNKSFILRGHFFLPTGQGQSALMRGSDPGGNNLILKFDCSSRDHRRTLPVLTHPLHFIPET